MRDDSGQDQSGSSRNGERGSHSRHTWNVESGRPADGTGVGCKGTGVVSGVRKGKDSVSIC